MKKERIEPGRKELRSKSSRRKDDRRKGRIETGTKGRRSFSYASVVMLATTVAHVPHPTPTSQPHAPHAVTPTPATAIANIRPHTSPPLQSTSPPPSNHLSPQYGFNVQAVTQSIRRNDR